MEDYKSSHNLPTNGPERVLEHRIDAPSILGGVVLELDTW